MTRCMKILPFSRGLLGKLAAVAGIMLGLVTPMTYAAQNPTGAQGGGAEMFGKFAVLGSVPAGKTLYLRIPGADSLEAGLVQTVVALAQSLGGQGDFHGAFGEKQDPRHGGATMTVTLKGQKIDVWIFTAVVKGGAVSTVIFCVNGAPPAALQTLLSFMPAPVKMQRYVFPDGSGSVDLPAGWTSPGKSLSFGFTIKGPAGQTFSFGNWMQINDPNCNLVRMAQKNYQTALAQYQRLQANYEQGMRLWQTHPNLLKPIPPVAPHQPDLDRDYPGLVFCPYCRDASEVIQKFFPAAERTLRKRNLPYATVDQIMNVVPAANPNPLVPNFSASLVYMAVTDHIGDNITKIRALNRIETYPMGDGSDRWFLCTNIMRAPDATFDRDIGVMCDMMSSIQMNIDKVNQDIRVAGQTVIQYGESRFENMMQQARDFNAAQEDRFESFQRQQAALRQIRSDFASDTIEYIRGVRDVLDTKTGKMHTTELNGSADTVHDLNDAAMDPTRFVEIPLRLQRN